MPGRAFGLQLGTNQGAAKYDDSIALLDGAWGSDQSATATIHSENQSDAVYEEVELRLRSSLAAHCASGYEINFRCSKTANAYSEIVRWNGRLGDFTYVQRGTGSQYGVTDGDVVRASITSNLIVVSLNGKEILRATDPAYGQGNPGIGFFLEGSGRRTGSCGFTRFSASAE